MTRIQVLGAGCARCNVLYEHAEQAARELGIDYAIEKVSDMSVIVSFGIMSTPALVVNGELKSSGRVPSTAQLKEMLS